MRSGLVTTDSIPVLAAGVGIRHRSRWLLRSVSFRVNARPPDTVVLGIAGQPAEASAVVGLLESVIRIRGMIEHAARAAGIGGRDRARRTAAILDRLALTPWADVRLGDAPRAVSRRAGLAAAAGHEPELLLLDRLLDGLAPRERASVAAGMRELTRDTIIIAAGNDATTLRLTCDEVLTLSDGILTGDKH